MTSFTDDVMHKAEKVIKHGKRGFFSALIRTGTGVSSLNFFLVCTTLVGIGLLAIVPFAIIWEVMHNNTISSDLSGWAAYIGAVSAMFATAGIAKSWTNYSEQKFATMDEETEEQEYVEQPADMSSFESSYYMSEPCEQEDVSYQPVVKKTRRTRRRKSN